VFLRSGQLLPRRCPLGTAETGGRQFGARSSVLERATHISPTNQTLRRTNPRGCPINGLISVSTIATTHQLPTTKTSKGEIKCQIKKIASHDIATRRSRSRNLASSRISQCNRHRWSRSHSPRVRSRSQRSTIKSRKSTLRLQWV